MSDEQQVLPVADANSEVPQQQSEIDEAEADPRVQKANAQAARYRVERNTARAEMTALQAEVASLNQQLAEATQAAQQAQLDQWRATALAEQGLPLALADRLQGDSPEAITEDAARLAKLFPLRRNSRTGHMGTAPAPTRAEQIFARIEGRADDVFSLLLQSNLGGGTFEVKHDD